MKRVCRQTALLLFLLAHVFCAIAQFDMPPMGLRGAAMGGTSVALDDASSALYNITAASRHRTVIAASYRQDYLLSGMAHKWIAASTPLTATGAVVAGYHHYGNATYNEQRLAAGYSQQISSWLAAGVTLDYLYSGVGDGHYTPLRALSFTAAIHAQIGQQWAAGVRLANAASILTDNAKAPYRLNIGLAHHPSRDWTTSIEIEHCKATTLRFGAEYTFLDHFAARIGLATNPMEYTFGLAYNQNHYSIDLALSHHHLLGITPMIGAVVEL